MGAISRINKSSLNQRTKTQLRKALVGNQNIKVLASSYTHPQATGTTLADISGFKLPVDAGKTYKYTVSIVATANASGGAKFALTGPTLSYLTGQVQADGTSTTSTTFATVAAGATAAAVEFFAVGIFKPTANGTVQVQAGQNASHASDPVFLAGSFLQLEEVLV